MFPVLLAITLGLGLGGTATSPVSDLIGEAPTVMPAPTPKILQVYRMMLEPAECSSPLDGLTYPHVGITRSGPGSRQLLLLPTPDARAWDRL